MAKFNKFEVSALVQLLESGCVSSSGLGRSVLFDSLERNSCVRKEQITRRRYQYILVDEKGLRVCCSDYDIRLSDLEGCLKKMENSTMEQTPSDRIKVYGEDHFGRRLLWKGCFIKSNYGLYVRYAGRDVWMDKEHPLLVEDFGLLELNWSVNDLWIVENYQCFKDFSWIRHFNVIDETFFVICRWPSSSREVREEYCSRPWRNVYYFGDYDPAGINIFQTEYASLSGVNSYQVPESFGVDILHGSSGVYQKQRRYWTVLGMNDVLRKCLELIHKYRRALLQEYYID